jgi:nucleolar protein 56
VAFVEAHVPKAPKPGKPAKALLGVAEPKIGTALGEAAGVACNSNETILELIRGVRAHFARFVEALGGGNAEKAQLGLAHSYSRAKVKFNVNKSDNMIIQAIALLDQLDKDLNTFSMRVREWYGWHFPELARIVKDNAAYARVAQAIGSRSTLTEEKRPALDAITLDEDVTAAIFEANRVSMGMDISDIDLANVDHFTARLVGLQAYRAQLSEYLHAKMDIVAPNLAALIGDTVGARLISHAGSLTNLAKAPASTVQILGAEKALFRALKTKGNTPKYGLIFHSSFIGRAAAKNKGRISRYLANKCSIASRIDSFSERATSKYGEVLKDQVEQRLRFYEDGTAPARNADVMAKVGADLAAADGGGADEAAPKKKKRTPEEKAARKAAKAAAAAAGGAADMDED